MSLGFVLFNGNLNALEQGLSVGISQPKNGVFPTLADGVLFRTDRDGNFQIYSCNSDGTSQTNQSKNSGTNNEAGPYAFRGGDKIALSSDISGNQVYSGDFSLASGITSRVQISSETIATSVHSFNPIVTNTNDVILWEGWETATVDNTRGALRARKIDSNGQPTGSVVTLTTGLAANARRGQMSLNADNTLLFYAYLPFGAANWILRVGSFNKSTLTLSGNIDITSGSNKTHPVVNFAGDKLIAGLGTFPNINLYKYNLSGTTISGGIQLTSLGSFELGNRLSEDQNDIVYYAASSGNDIYARNNVGNDVIDNTLLIVNNAANDAIPWMGTLKL